MMGVFTSDTALILDATTVHAIHVASPSDFYALSHTPHSSSGKPSVFLGFPSIRTVPGKLPSQKGLQVTKGNLLPK